VTEAELVERARHGDLDAFAALTRGSTDRLFTTARMILRDDSLAEDAVQDALLRAWVDLRALRDPERFQAWLHRSLVHACYRVARRRRMREVRELTAVQGRALETGDVQADLLLRDQLERGFQRLSTEQRTVLVLHHYGGFSLAETADVLGVPIGTVQSRIHRAVAAMRAALDADDRPTALATEGL
jgi:RNA polymerase sigma-70 factor (ECF subfamily)